MEKKSRGKTVTIVVLILVILCLGGYIYYDKVLNKETEKTETKKVKTEKTNDWYVPNGTAKDLTIYGVQQEYDGEKSLYITEDPDNSNEEYQTLATYKCSNYDCKYMDNYSVDLTTMIIKDGDYIVYDFKNNKAKKIDLGKYKNKINHFDIFGFGDTCFRASSKISNGKTYYEIYESTDDTVSALISPNYKMLAAYTDEEYENYNKIAENDDTSYFTKSQWITSIDYLDGKVKFIKGDTVYTYNEKNDKLTTKKYKKTIVAQNGYVGVIDKNNNIKVLDENNKEKATLGKITDEMTVIDYASNWREATQNEKEGLYIQVYDPSVTTEQITKETQPSDTSDLGYDYYYIPSTGETGKIATYIQAY